MDDFELFEKTYDEAELVIPDKHFFQPQLAIKYGVDEAIMLNHIMYWIASNQLNGRNYSIDRTWTYYTLEGFTEIFPYWSYSQIRRIIKSLINQDVIITGNYNKHRWDRTTWYALVDEEHMLETNNVIDDIDKCSSSI